jgi:CysZ protein
VIKSVRDFGTGIGLLGRGLRLVLGNRGLLVRGALPVLVTSVVLFAALLGLALGIGDLITWATPFADGWSEVWRGLFRTALGVGIVIGAVALVMVLFSALTLIIGGPFYESIAEEVEDRELGGVPEAQQIGWARSAWIGLRDGVRLAGLAILFAVVLFAAGFIPVLGQTVVPVVAVFAGAWLLAVELTAIPFVRRGRSLKQRRRSLGRRRSMALGFAVPVYLLCLVPLLALLVFPAAMAGGTLLAAKITADEV